MFIKNLKKITVFISPYKNHFILGVSFLCLTNIVALIFPYMLGLLVNVASGKSSTIMATIFTNIGCTFIKNPINQIGALLVIILLLQSICSFFRVYFLALVCTKSLADIRKKLYAKLIILPTKFYDKTRTGELISRMTTDITLLQDVLSVTLAQFFRQVITIIFSMILLCFITPKLTHLMFFIFPIIIFTVFFFGKFIRKMSKKRQGLLAFANIIVNETLQAIHTVKAFNNEWLATTRYHQALQKVINIALSMAAYRGIFITIIITSISGCMVSVMWYGALLVQSGAMQVGDLLSFVLYMTFMGGAVAGLGETFSQLQKSVGASERIIELMQEQGESIDLIPTITKKIRGYIQYQHVYFSYPTRNELTVLRDISFEIHPGEKIALVGPSGAGKSTIIHLLLQFYHQQKGSIIIDGINIQKYSLSALRKQIGIVPQEIILFGNSIRENIAYGNPDASEAAIQAAAKKAYAWDFINTLPDQLDTIVGERGMKLSHGQRQRIAIARTILKDPSILILDEATSSLDTHAEAMIQNAFDEIMQNRTTIIIAHRLTTIQKADKIYVVQAGNIVQKGTHENLITNTSGIYYTLAKNQFKI